MREFQPRPKLGAFEERLSQFLKTEKELPRREQRTAQQLFEELQREGFAGGYDSVRRYVQQWKDREKNRQVKAFIPLSFAPGEAFQFDWSYEYVELGGVNVKVKVAHFRLCHSRMPFCVAYTAGDAGDGHGCPHPGLRVLRGHVPPGDLRQHEDGGDQGAAGQGRARSTRRFQALASHYLFEPVACTPAAGWEKGQVENQVGVLRQRLFVPRLKFADLIELNRYLTDQCRTLCRRTEASRVPGSHSRRGLRRRT